ncbi:hypothetical protein FSP39_011205 [Pinctada imbricata]|uniref:Uncharacterized protein n=1 Tax=Pinctada imbricata TaxID=66713 RepID=A0AA89C743_PINIB|nr:hypothetical protein FSP39_011205 [Pinctada imbricata]
MTSAMDQFAFERKKQNVLKTKIIESSVQNKENALAILQTLPRHVQHNVLWYLTSFDHGEPDIAVEDVHHYLQISAVLSGLERLRSQCEVVLLNNLTAENAIYMLHEGEKHGLRRLEKESIYAISQHLRSIAYQPEFLTLEKHQIQSIIEHHPGDESLLKQFAGIWDQVFGTETAKPIGSPKSDESDFEQTQQHGDSCVRRFGLSFMTNEKHHLQVAVRDFSTHQVYTTNCTNEVGKVVKVSPNFTACVIQVTESDPPHIFITGGADDNRLTLECDIVRGKWKRRKSMTWGREGHVLCTLNNTIYAIGGFRRKGDERHLVRDIEKYDCEKKTWSSMTSLATPVYSCAAVSVGCKIFIIGGKNALGSEVNEIQVLDTEKGTLSVFNGLPQNCAIGKAILMNNAIFFASTAGHLIRIDPCTMYIQNLKPQPQTSNNFALFSAEDYLVITYHGDNGSKEVCTYKYMPDKWSSIDRYTDKHAFRVYGHCTVMYPKQIMQVPFCD